MQSLLFQRDTSLKPTAFRVASMTALQRSRQWCHAWVANFRIVEMFSTQLIKRKKKHIAMPHFACRVRKSLLA
jgi:hypothetical protein